MSRTHLAPVVSTIGVGLAVSACGGGGTATPPQAAPSSSTGQPTPTEIMA